MSAEINERVSVVGAGAWGTALANSLAESHDVLIWALEDDVADSINTQHMNERFLPGFPLNKSLKATNSLSDISGSDVILLVVPAQFLRQTAKKMAQYIPDGLPVVLCSKGIELESLCLMTDVLAQEIPGAIPAVLSGPSFAVDVVAGLPTAVTLAVREHSVAESLSLIIGSNSLRPYISQDLIGAEVGGAVKNVLAIACGIVIGLELGKSAHAAIIARGFSEMTRLGLALGADASTLTGLCGLGDLILTCSSEQSRNMSFGLEIGRGSTIEDVLSARSAVTEGVPTSSAIESLASSLGVEMPICSTVAKIIRGDLTPTEAVKHLLNRPVKSEI